MSIAVLNVNELVLKDPVYTRHLVYYTSFIYLSLGVDQFLVYYYIQNSVIRETVKNRQLSFVAFYDILVILPVVLKFEFYR